MKQRRWLLQFAVAVVVMGIVFVILTSMDTFEALVRLTREHEEWELDEILIGVWLFLVAGLILTTYNLYGYLVRQRQQSQDLAEAKEKAEKLSQLKSNLLAMISHELRTPLTSISGFAKLIQKSLGDISGSRECSDGATKKMDRLQRNSEIIISEGDRLAELISNVLDLAEIESGNFVWNFRSISLQEVLDRSIEATDVLFVEKGLSLEATIEPNLPTIRGDFDRLVQVCINLLSNAVKFTPEGGVACRVFMDGASITVAVRDTGIGVLQGEENAIFDTFRQAGDVLTDKPKGTGLGLPICKEILKYHNGTIWCERNQTVGSTFAFSLPLVSPHPSH